MYVANEFLWYWQLLVKVLKYLLNIQSKQAKFAGNSHELFVMRRSRKKAFKLIKKTFYKYWNHFFYIFVLKGISRAIFKLIWIVYMNKGNWLKQNHEMKVYVHFFLLWKPSVGKYVYTQKVLKESECILQEILRVRFIILVFLFSIFFFILPT